MIGVGYRADRAIRLTTTAAVALLALIAGVVSFGHMHELARGAGEGPLTAALIPLSVDGMIVASSMSLLVDSRTGRHGGVLPWTLLVWGSAASLAANVAAASPAIEGRMIAAWPSFALMGAYELLMRQVRHTVNDNDEAGQQVQETVSVAGLGGQDVGMPRPEQQRLPGQPGRRTQSIVDACPGGALKPPRAGISRSRGRMCSDSPRLTEAAGLQRRAFEWAMANRSAEGALPTGRQIAEQFGRSARWGRLIKHAAARETTEPLSRIGA